MKSFSKFFSFVLVLSIVCVCEASQQTNTVPSPAPYKIISRDANSRVWERTTYEALPSGKVIPHKHHVTELATGLNYWDGKQWSLSIPSFQISADGQSVFATNLQHKVWLAANLNAESSVNITTPDGTALHTTPVAIGLYDETTSNTVIIAAITNCSGTLSSTNQVVYENAFDNVDADIVYTLKRGSFSQDILLKQDINPADYGLSSNSTIEIFTEFYHSTAPKVIGKSLQFGQLSFGQGRAYTAASTNQACGVPVSKKFTAFDGRTFLIESVRYNSLQNELHKLPLGGASQSAGAKIISTTKGRYANIPSPHTTTKATVLIRKKEPLVAEINQSKGVVVDYEALDGTMPEPMVFQGDTTYFISGSVGCDDAVFEGGTVIKYPNDTTADIEVDGNPTSRTGPYRPAIFTAGDDDTVGESMNGVWGGYTGTIQNGGYANPALELNTPSPLLENCRFCYAQQVIIGDPYPGGISCYDCQFLNCGLGVEIEFGTSSYYLFANCLFDTVNTVATDIQGDDDNVYCYNSTFDNCSSIFTYAVNFSYDDALIAVNSIFSSSGFGDGPNYGDNNGFYNCGSTFGSNVYTDENPPFQTVGGGNYYLADDTFRGKGTTNIDQAAQDAGLLYFEAAPTILPDLAKKTTWPPIVYANTNISDIVSWSPQAPRDTNSVLDLGYHYDPVDYAFCSVNVDSYTNITFTPGTAVAWFSPYTSSMPGWGVGSACGISLSDDASVTFEGTAASLCIFANYNCVQEGGNNNWMPGYLAGIANQDSYDPNNPAQLTATFTHFNHLAYGVNHYRDGEDGQPLKFSFNDCEFWGSDGGYTLMGAFSNCLIMGGFVENTSDSQYSFETNSYRENFQNCTFHNGTLELDHGEDPPYWRERISDCSFDGIGIVMPTNGLTCDYNAFLTAALLPISGPHDVTYVGDFNWESDWLGDFYLPSSSPLIQMGSTTSDQLGLYYFTTQTNQTPETNAPVDIGYHYVATDSDGNPLNEMGLTLTNQAVPSGDVVVFNIPVSSSCDGPFTYQWLHDGTNILSGVDNEVITTFAGNGSPGDLGDSNPATAAELRNPNGVAVDGAGNLYIADSGNNVVRMVSTNGIITTVAGNGSSGYAGDGNPATSAELRGPMAVALDNLGNLYVADTGNNVIREVATNGTISTVAGNNSIGGSYSGDLGLATNAALWNPSGVTVDASGNLYIADFENNVVRMVDTNGEINTIAGNYDLGGAYSGDGGPAVFAGMNQPSGVALDSAGNLYIADSGDSLILKVDTNGIISAYAGDINEGPGYSGDWGQATNSQLNQPFGVTLDNSGNVYFSDTYNQVIRKVDTNGIITTVAGNFNIGTGYFGDGGLAINAALNDPIGIAVDPAGNNLYIADSANNVVRQVNNLLVPNSQGLELSNVSTNDAGTYQVIVSSPCGSATSTIATLSVWLPPAITTQPLSQVVIEGSNVMFSVTASGTLPLGYQWLFNGSPISGATGNSYTLYDAQLTNASSYSVVISNAAGGVTSDDADLIVVGMNGIIVNGSSPPNPGPIFACSGSPITLQAMPNPLTASFPAGVPVWTIANQPPGSSLGNPPAGNPTATITPVVLGQYVLQAACGTSTATFTINCVGETDSDYDGICDCQEVSDGTDPTDPSSVLPVRLAYWNFDNTNTWVGAEGQLPLMVTNVIGVPSWDTNAVEISATNALLVYRDAEADSCYANINLRTGTVRFWFRPDWSSTNAGGTGPQSEARLIEIGSKGTVNGWWGLAFDRSGTNLYFGTQTNSALTLSTNLSAAISWPSNTWHQIVLTYSTNSSSLYLDGEPVVTNGSGVAYYPGPDVRALGFAIGSSLSGTNQADGAFEDLETFNYALDADSIQSDYETAISLDSDGDGWPNIIENMLGTDPYNHGAVPPGITIVNPGNGSTISR